MRVGIELARAHGRWRVTKPALSIAGWGHSSTLVTFHEAPLRSRTVTFRESGSDLGLSSSGLPSSRRSSSGDTHPLRSGWVCSRLRPHARAALAQLCGWVPTRHSRTAECPEPLCPTLSRRGVLRNAWESITPPSSLIRAHASDHVPPDTSVSFGARSLQVVVAPCWNLALPDVIPAPPCVGAWTPTPPSPSGAFAHFFPESIDLATKEHARQTELPLQCNFRREP
jgi:hypothetical protein